MSNVDDAENNPRGARRSRGTREETEAQILQAARGLLRRRGVLGGLTMRDVSRAAKVNHGQLYQYFGNRQALLRAAIADLLNSQATDRHKLFALPFVDRRLAFFKARLSSSELSKLEAVLALDGDPGFEVLPEFELALEALRRDVDTGTLSGDPVVAHVVTNALVQGYCIFRESYARSVRVPVEELDKRVATAYERMVRDIALQ